ncbi:hypothetical protein PR048_020171 [Dryococelus australis]|uniref:Uncharacterized protein n=1 Tax=Dryococelus australis TaxID=614101 RepID=A0ABQ9H5X6_9NEOP|nr:hypothetical protein PR048_020171 [Dryococelus australis]
MSVNFSHDVLRVRCPMLLSFTPVSYVEIGDLVKKLLKETKVSEKEMQVFRFDCRKVLISVIGKVRKRSGVS